MPSYRSRLASRILPDRRVMLCALALCALLGCQKKPRSLRQIEAEIRELPALYLTAETGKEVLAPIDEGVFIDEETGELIEFPSESPVWIDPVAEGSTPMCHVLYHAHQILTGWIQQHPDSFPPIVIHISDGESQDVDKRETFLPDEGTDGGDQIIAIHFWKKVGLVKGKDDRIY